MTRYYFGSFMNVIGSGVATSLVMSSLKPLWCSIGFALGILASWAISSSIHHD